jgi:hypothetical protein
MPQSDCADNIELRAAAGGLYRFINVFFIRPDVIYPDVILVG